MSVLEGMCDLQLLLVEWLKDWTDQKSHQNIRNRYADRKFVSLIGLAILTNNCSESTFYEVLVTEEIFTKSGQGRKIRLIQCRRDISSQNNHTRK